MSLQDVTNEQLEAELERRRKAEIEASKPIQLDTPDLSALRRVCQEYIDCLASDEYCGDDDFDHYIYEAAMVALYGKDVWGFINSRR